MFRPLMIIVALLAAAAANAQQPSYNYIDASWQKVDFDGGLSGDIDGDRLSIGGAFDINDNWHIVAGYSSTDLDFGLDLDQLVIGAGYHDAISANSNYFVELLFVQADASANGFNSLEESGLGARVGLRSNVTDKVELGGSINYVELDNGADGTSVEGAAWYSMSRTFSLGLLASFDEDAATYGIGGRVYF